MLPLWLVIALSLVVGLVVALVFGLCAAASLDMPEPRDPVLDSDQYRPEAHVRLQRLQDTRRKP